jgi:glycine C-acetyltransferase
MDLFAKMKEDRGPLGKWSRMAHGYFTFPKLEGELGGRMTFNGKEMIVWSVNNYLGLGNHPEVRKVDGEASRDWGLAYPMGSRMMSGETKYHDQLERELADFVNKEDVMLLNFGYQGIMSIVPKIDCILGWHHYLKVKLRLTVFWQLVFSNRATVWASIAQSQDCC